MDSTVVDVLRVSTSGGAISVEASWWLLVAIVVLVAGIALWRLYRSRHHLRTFDMVSVDIKLGNIGSASFKPNTQDIEIAHKVWAELVTRKAAIPVDVEHDVIAEIYDSWYQLFTTVRELVGTVPPHLIRQEKSTQEIVRITTEALNNGLRPHLTRWQARFRNWYKQREERLKEVSPQELQKEFPEYEALISDMKSVNELMIGYAAELRKIAHGR